ncbi:MAG: hypothetical protein IPJ75_14445 [Ignavibacteriales bacterium]|nr:hypothetical protein [Ignavibacteriales bacterium]
MNRDGFRDIIVQRYGTQKPPVIDIYFGGPGLIQFLTILLHIMTTL